MSDNLNKFLETVSKDKELQEKLKAMTDKSEIIAMAKELGFDLHEADLTPPDGELSTDELSAVAGGTEQQDWADFNNCSCSSNGNGTQDCFCAAGGGGQADENGDICACVGYGSGTRGSGNKCTCVIMGVGTDDDI